MGNTNLQNTHTAPVLLFLSVIQYPPPQYTPAHSQDGDLSKVAAALLSLAGRGPPHQGPFLLAAAAADVLQTLRAPDGVQVVAGVLGGPGRSPRGHRSQRRGRGGRGGWSHRRPGGKVTVMTISLMIIRISVLTVI